MSEETEKQPAGKRRAGRSPAYPSIDVKKALEKSKQLHDQEHDFEAPVSSAMAAWGYSIKSSSGRQALATLKYYGLIDVIGEGDQKKVKVSDIARRILMDEREDQTEKLLLIKKVALNPSAHKTIYDKYPTGLASDSTIEHFLKFEAGFNKDAASELLQEFKETATYASLYKTQKDVDNSSDENHNGDNQNEQFDLREGDKIQWTHNGIKEFPNGGNVLGLSEDGQWVFTDQRSSAVPISEVSVMENNRADTPPNPPAHIAAAMRAAIAAEGEVKKGTRKAVFPVENSDVTLIFPEGLSSDGLEELGEYLEIFLRKEKKRKTDGS